MDCLPLALDIAIYGRKQHTLTNIDVVILEVMTAVSKVCVTRVYIFASTFRCCDANTMALIHSPDPKPDSQT
jgi:hypothetical protein